jgi:glycopeptide antibiotics resistance protein
MNSSEYLVSYYWLSALVFYIFIWILSSVGNIDVSLDIYVASANLVGYALLYSVLTILIFRAVIATLEAKVSRLAVSESKREEQEDLEFSKTIKYLVLVIAILATTILAVADEFHQSYVLGRVASVYDIYVNSLGITLGALVALIAPQLMHWEKRIFSKS